MNLNGRLHRAERAQYMQELCLQIDFPVNVATLSPQKQGQLWQLFLWLDANVRAETYEYEPTYRRFNRFLESVTI
jgi:hypothetical protein